MKSYIDLAQKVINLHINGHTMQLTLFFVPKKVVGQISHHNSTFEDAREIKKSWVDNWNELKWLPYSSDFFCNFFSDRTSFEEKKDFEISIIINTPFENWIRLPKCDKVHEKDSPLANNDIHISQLLCVSLIWRLFNSIFVVMENVKQISDTFEIRYGHAGVLLIRNRPNRH